MLQHTYKKLVLNFGVTALSTCLFVFRNVLFPAMVVSIANPLIPFVFAAISLLISVANHYLSQYFDQQKPQYKKVELSEAHGLTSKRNSFFYTSSNVFNPKEVMIGSELKKSRCS
jgi:hypothetical protein